MSEDSPVNELLGDDSFAEHDLLAVGTTTLRHSATTDTLDSVLLETTPLDDDLQDEQMTFEPEENKGDIDQTVDTSENSCTDENTANIKTSTKEGENQNNSSRSQVNISSYFTANVDNGKTMDPFNDIGDSSFFDAVEPSQGTTKATLTSIDSSDPVSTAEDLAAVVGVSETQSDAFSSGDKDSTDGKQQTTTVNVDEEVCERHEHLEARLSHEEPESVDFQVVPEDNGLSVMEASLQV